MTENEACCCAPQPCFYPFFGVNTPFDPEDRFVTARFLSPLALGIIRLILAIYGIIVIAVDITFNVIQFKDIGTYFAYFTDETYIGLIGYMLFAAGHTLWYTRKGKSPLNGWYRPFQLAHTFLFSTIVTYPIIVTIVYWSILADSSTFSTPYDSWANISKHGLNSGYALFEIIFSAVGRQAWSHLICIITLLLLYLAVAYITHATQGIYLYDFLNPSEGIGLLIGYIGGILVGCVIIFLIVNCIKWGLANITTAKKYDRPDDLYEMRE